MLRLDIVTVVIVTVTISWGWWRGWQLVVVVVVILVVKVTCVVLRRAMVLRGWHVVVLRSRNVADVVCGLVCGAHSIVLRLFNVS